MYRLYSTVKERLARYLMADTTLGFDVSAGDRTITLADNFKSFGFESLNDLYPTIGLMDDNTDGSPDGLGGFIGIDLIDLTDVDTSTGVVTSQSEILNNWTQANGTIVQRAPAGVFVKRVVIGDLSIITDYPTVCVVPTNKTIEWSALHTSIDRVSIDIMIYTESGDTEQGTIDMLKLTDVVEWMLMSNLHLTVENAVNPYEVTSAAMVKNIDYGVVQKGNEFLKVSKIIWEGELHKTRDYLPGNLPYRRSSQTI